MKIAVKNQIAKPQKPFWDLYQDGLTMSFINKWLACRRQCYLEYVEGWTPKQEDIWFTFGKLVHAILSDSYAAGRNICVEYLNKDPLLGQLSLAIPDKEALYGLAETVLQAYFVLYEQDFKHNWVHNETNFKIDYLSPIDKFTSIPLRGRWDGGIVTPKGSYYLMDHKILSMIQEDNIQLVAKYDTQCMLYLLAASKLSQSGPPVGIIYNIIRRPNHKQKENESLKDFGKRLTDIIYKDLGHFFIRIPIQITQDEINNWKDTFLYGVLIEIEEWVRLMYNPTYVNPNALVSKYGRCQMFDIIVKNDYSGYYKREKVFHELD
jgi:hypothetical protein